MILYVMAEENGLTVVILTTYCTTQMQKRKSFDM